ncbi:hypothetical protein BH11MYX4_BH11MYX4_31890 [soil metagenome]
MTRGRRSPAWLAGVALLVVSYPIAARGDGSGLTTKLSTEVAGYQDSTATSVLTPSVGASVESPTAGWGVNGRYLVDVVTAASPDIVATASPRWTEVRHAGNMGVRYKPDTFGVAATASASYTNDYLALGGGGQLTKELDDKTLTLVGGYSYGRDTIGRTGTPFAVFSRSLSYHSLNAGLSRVVNTGLVLGLYGDAIIERGDQSKPYRYIPMFSAADAAQLPRAASVDDVANKRVTARPLEQLPLARERYALTGRLGWRGESTTVRLEQRIYIDTWGLKASTTDARYFIDLSNRVTVWPHLRVHAQSGVDFWRRAYIAVDANHLPAYRTGDRELGRLTNVGGGGGIRVGLGKAGAIEDWVLISTIDGTWTSFGDALYVRDRFSGLLSVALEATF